MNEEEFEESRTLRETLCTALRDNMDIQDATTSEVVAVGSECCGLI